MNDLTLFVATTPGLEAITAREVTGTLPHRPIEIQAGGIELRGSVLDAFALNLRLATASRVLIRMAEFRAAHFGEVEKQAARINWRRWLAPGQAVTWAVTSRKSRLYHTGAIGERLFAAARSAVAGIAVADTSTALVEGARIVVRVVRDRFTVSFDTSGEHLHERGDRVLAGAAPLRETMAAALLSASGWSRSRPLFDPMCGSGTVVLEAARRATSRAPGLGRTFAIERLPVFQGAPAREAESLREAARAAQHPALAPIVGRDRDPTAIDGARANVEAAGFADTVHLEIGAVSSARPPAPHEADASGETACGGGPEPDLPAVNGPAGWVVTNPPWGLRMGDEAPLLDLYAALGRVVRSHFEGWALALITPHERLAKAADRRLERSHTFRQGGVDLSLWVHSPGL